MNFDQFKATRTLEPLPQFSSRVGTPVDDEQPEFVFSYDGVYMIEVHNPDDSVDSVARFWTVSSNEEIYTTSLDEAERWLWDNFCNCEINGLRPEV